MSNAVKDISDLDTSLVERLRRLLQDDAPEEWPVPIAKADLRALAELATQRVTEDVLRVLCSRGTL